MGIYLSLGDGATLSNDVSNRPAERLHRPLGLCRNLPHLDELLVHGELGSDELIG